MSGLPGLQFPKREHAMPRTQISIPGSIDFLSILEEDGTLDSSLEPAITPERHIEMYSAMLLGRRFDERMLDLQRQGRIGTFPPIKGQEAAQIGAVFQLRESDWLVPAFRETAAEIWRGRSLESVILYYNGYNEGTVIPRDQKDLPMAIPVASQILHAAGLGYAAKYRQSGEIVMTFFGDGATSEGDFHEAMNCAAVYNLPVLFICQNNQWAISIPLRQQTASKTIAQKALAYGMEGLQVDGNDILSVYSGVREAAERARNGGGPTLIECVTYRIMMHTTADDPSRYRQEEEVEKWRKKDPLQRYTAYLLENGTLTEQRRQEIEESVMERIDQSVTGAEEQMQRLNDPLEMFDHLFHEVPPSLAQQKTEAAARLARVEKEDDHD